jgi:hypothetical protein
VATPGPRTGKYRPAVARHEQWTGLSRFLPRSWDHRGCQLWDRRRVVLLVGRDARGVAGLCVDGRPEGAHEVLRRFLPASGPSTRREYSAVGLVGAVTGSSDPRTALGGPVESLWPASGGLDALIRGGHVAPGAPESAGGRRPEADCADDDRLFRSLISHPEHDSATTSAQVTALRPPRTRRSGTSQARCERPGTCRPLGAPDLCRIFVVPRRDPRTEAQVLSHTARHSTSEGRST